MRHSPAVTGHTRSPPGDGPCRRRFTVPLTSKHNTTRALFLGGAVLLRLQEGSGIQQSRCNTVECRPINSYKKLQAAGIPVKERVKVSQNWRHGRCRQETLLKWKRNLMPWMHLDGEYLYLSQAEDIRAYRLRPDSAGLQRRPQAIFSGHQEDVCRFVLAGSHLVSGGGDGNIILSKVHGSFSIKFSAHEQEVNCVDCQGGIIVSGSRDRTAKVWSLASGRAGHCLHTVQTEDRVWSIAISPLLSSFVTGTACCGHTSPLRIWDLQSSNRKCVLQWEEPHDSALYCLRSDGNHMIASGSAYYGVVRLWDKRQSGCLQVRDAGSSPVYCLRFSTTHLYAALASALHALDFTTP
nr:F-box/WD repeat-containing protein 4 [Pelodiscus sinensis]|eukprot:XP_025044782.1 F-box/WD repeat-containing protein 4 [Pelodiscus sinensis]